MSSGYSLSKGEGEGVGRASAFGACGRNNCADFQFGPGRVAKRL